MIKLLLSSLLIAVSLAAFEVLPGDRYLSVNDGRIELVIAKEYEDKTDELLGFENEILDRYEKSFGYRLDDKLYLILASSNNQIANAYSTQFPLNMQVNYVGGSLLADYFSTTSWLKNILIHESAHNFQLNAKKNPISAFAYKIVKNTPYTSLLFVPIFPVPNIFESSFILEGNAVLNESLFANGGRLYSGAALAMTLTQAKGGFVTPKRVYNDHLFFPYGTHHYIVGGYFQLYLARKYGLQKTNRYFLAYSNQWLPFFTNSVFKAHFGQNFENELEEFNESLLKKAENFTPTKGQNIVFSKSSIALNSDENEIFFLISDQKSPPELIRYNKKTCRFSKKRANFLFGQVFKIDKKFYTQSYAKTKIDKIEIALFDKNAVVKRGSEGKVLQTVLPDGKKLYFDVKSSLNSLKLYADDTFIGSVNSSVVSDRDGNIYYFKQKGKNRTLYKNSEPLFSFKSYYSKVADIDSYGRILFISNSKYGSTLYRYDGSIQRVLKSDDLLDAKLIDDEHVLAEVIRADGIRMIKTDLISMKEEPYEVSYFFEKEFADTYYDRSEKIKRKDYAPVKNLHYSSLLQSLEVSRNGGLNFNLRATFADPLERNFFSLYLSKYEDDTIGGIGYANSENILNYSVDIYAVIDHAKDVRDRGFGVNAYVNYPLYRHTYKRSDIEFSYHLDSDKDERSPFSVAISYSDTKRFGYSFYSNDKKAFSVYGVNDRSDFIYGVSYRFYKGFEREFFTGAKIEYVKSDVKNPDSKRNRGVWIDNSDLSIVKDPSRLVMPSLSNDLYVEEAIKAKFSISKVLNQSLYFYSFPLSLRREALYADYSYYNLKKNRNRVNVNEYTLGLTLELLLMHKSAAYVSFEYLLNDDIRDSNGFKMVINTSF